VYLGLSSNANSNPSLDYYLNQVIFTTCKGTSNFGIYVSQAKFTLWKIMLRKNFGEFMEFFLKCLNTFKIQSNFKLDFVLEFIIEIQ
jgi:hypothetical protein